MNEDSRFKVIPGLSIRSDELKRRIKSRSIQINEDGKSYSVDKSIHDTLKMDRPELFRSHLKDVQNTKVLQEKLTQSKRLTKEQAERARIEKIKAEAKAEAIAELSKSKG